CSNDYDYVHKRYRVQLSFALVFFANTSARGSAYVESSSYRGTNEAIAYKDCYVHLLQDANGSFTFKLKVIQRYLKGRRNDKNDKDIVKIYAICAGVANKIKDMQTGSSIGHQRDENAPKGLTCKEKDEFRQRPEVQELNMRIKEAKAKMPPNPNKGSA
ncbi:hypothetical protein V502_04413, partial [Pseudogymnoascus sp. VKM F-4520 (FW-2644)]